MTRVSLALPGAVQILLARSAIKKGGGSLLGLLTENAQVDPGELGLQCFPGNTFAQRILGFVICTAGHVAPMSSQGVSSQGMGEGQGLWDEQTPS